MARGRLCRPRAVRTMGQGAGREADPVRILLVEDDPGLGAALSDHVEAEGHTPDWVRDLADARASLDTIAYDLVLLDLTLPDGHGVDFLRRLRRDGGQVPVIILTARIGSVSRRYAGNPNPRITFGALAVDLAARSILGPDGGAIDLSQREWAIFEALLRAPGAVLSRARLEEHLYSFDAEVESNTIEVYVSRLRRKLGRGSIETLRGLGYRLGRP